MAKQSKKQVKAGNAVELTADQKKEQAEILAKAELTKELLADAEGQGAAIGGLAAYRMESQQAMCDAALTLFALGHEKYVANITPAQDAYIKAVVAKAWATAYPGTEPKVSEDSTLANFSTAAKNIARALSLDGWIKTEKGDTIAIRSKLETMLKGRVSAKMRFESGGKGIGFYAAAKEAYRLIGLAKDQSKLDVKLAGAAKGALVTKETNRGRPLSAMPQDQVDRFLTKLPLSAPTTIEQVIDAAIQTLAAAVPLTAEDPKARAVCSQVHAWFTSEGKKFAEQCRKQYSKALASMVSPDKQPITPDQQAQANAAGVAISRKLEEVAANSTAPLGPMQTPAQQDAPKLDAEHRVIVDQVAASRRAKPRKGPRPMVQGEQIKAA